MSTKKPDKIASREDAEALEAWHRENDSGERTREARHPAAVSKKVTVVIDEDGNHRVFDGKWSMEKVLATLQAEKPAHIREALEQIKGILADGLEHTPACLVFYDKALQVPGRGRTNPGAVKHLGGRFRALRGRLVVAVDYQPR